MTGKPVLRDYFDRMRARPSYRDASINCEYADFPSQGIFNGGVFLIVSVISLLIAAFFNYDETFLHSWLTYAVVIAVIVCLGIAFAAKKGRDKFDRLEKRIQAPSDSKLKSD